MSNTTLGIIGVCMITWMVASTLGGWIFGIVAKVAMVAVVGALIFAWSHARV